MRAEGLACRRDPARIVLRPSPERLDQIAHDRIAGDFRQGEEFRRGGLECGGEFALCVLHAGGQARIEVEPADENGERLAGRVGRQTFDDHPAVSVKVVDQFAAFAPGHARASDGDGGDALVDLQGQRLRADFGRQFQAKAALQVGVSSSGLDQ
ncbi:hypothetical protein D3C77_304550 [compost metagenome]